MKAIILAPAARDELAAAADWYEARVAGLGERFVLHVGDVLGHIQEAPSAFARWETDRRFQKVVLHRFPYVVFYRELETHIEIVAIAHGARHPGYWLKRT